MKRYRWTTVFDEYTCVECLWMDGRVFSQREVDDMNCPPLHGRDAEHARPCRCKLVAIEDRR